MDEASGYKTTGTSTSAISTLVKYLATLCRLTGMERYKWVSSTEIQTGWFTTRVSNILLMALKLGSDESKQFYYNVNLVFHFISKLFTVLMEKEVQ